MTAADIKRQLRAIERELVEIQGAVEELKPLRPVSQGIPGDSNPLVALMKIAVTATHNVQVLLTSTDEIVEKPKASPLSLAPPGVDQAKWDALPIATKQKVMALRAALKGKTA